MIFTKYTWQRNLLTSSQQQMTVTYQVGGGGHLDIDFWVCRKNDTGFLSPRLHPS